MASAGEPRLGLGRIVAAVALSIVLLATGGWLVGRLRADNVAASATPTPRTIAPYALPAALRAYHVMVTELVGGDVALLGQTTLRTGGGPHGIALQPGGRYLWVTDSDAAAVWVIDRDEAGGMPRVVSTIAVGPAPVHIAFNPDATRAYVTDFGGSEISVVDVVARKRIASISTPLGPHGIAIAPDGRWLYVACPRGGAFVVIDTQTEAVVTTVPLRPGATPYGVAISPDGQHVFVTDAAFGQLLAIDTANRVITGSAPVGVRPALVAWVPRLDMLAVADNGSGAITLVDAVTMRQVSTIITGAGPHGIAASPDGAYIAVANTTANTITVVDTASHLVVAQQAVGHYPNDVAIIP